MSPQGAANVEHLLRREAASAVTDAGAPGAALLVASGPRRWRAAAGASDRVSAEAMRGDERFRIGSVTKPFTAAVILSLADDGLLGLGDPVADWLPELRHERITIGQLGTHTSGLANYTDDPRVPLARFDGRPLSPERLLSLALEAPRAFPPGERFDYSNTNFIALGLIAERASGQPFAELVERRILGPLRLTGTDVALSPEIAGRHARGYLDPRDPRLVDGLGDQPIPASLDVTGADPREAWASGGLVSTLDDIATFFAAYLGGRLVGEASTRAITTAALGADGRRTNSGLGVVRVELGDRVAWGKGGEVPGFVTRVTASSDGTTVAVSMLNSSGPIAADRVVAASQRAYSLVADGRSPVNGRVENRLS